MQPLKRHAVVDFALRVRGIAEGGSAARTPIPTVGTVTDQIVQHSPFQSTLPRSGGADSKLFCRVRRLQQVLNLLAGKTQVDWADIAFSCGYFDQAHLIHDFRAFADCTPTEYLAQRGFHPCHVVLPD